MSLRSLTGLIAVAVAALALYAGALANPFISDDETVVAGNPTIATPSVAGLAGLWTADYWTGIAPDGRRTRLTVDDNLYRPLTIVSFWIDAWLGAREPWRFRLTNVLLHALAAWLVGILCARLVHPWAGAAAALFVLVHPVATDVVNRLVGRADLLVLIGVAGALAAEARALRDGWTAGRTLLLASAVALALGAKESGIIVVPLALIAPAITHGERPSRAGLVAVLTPAIAYAVARACVVGRPHYDADGTWDLIGNPLWGASLGQRLPAAAALAASYLRLLVAPWPLLAFDVPARLPTWTDPAAWIGGAALAAITVAAVAWRHRRAVVAFAALWWLAGFAIVSQVIAPIGAYREVRFAYPLLGAAALVVAYVVEALRHARRPLRIAAASAAAAATTLAIAAVVARNADFRSFAALVDADLRRQPDHPSALLRFASEHEGGARDAEAGEAYARVTALAPDSAQGWYERAGWEASHGRFDAAQTMYAHAVALQPSHHPALTALATLAIEAGRLDDAERYLDAAEHAAPDDAMVALYRAILDEHRGDVTRARTRLEHLVATHPRFAPAIQALARLQAAPRDADGNAAGDGVR